MNVRCADISGDIPPPRFSTHNPEIPTTIYSFHGHSIFSGFGVDTSIRVLNDQMSECRRVALKQSLYANHFL